MLFELFHRLVQQLGDDSGSGGSDVPTSPLAVLPLLGAEIVQVGTWPDVCPEKCQSAVQVAAVAAEHCMLPDHIIVTLAAPSSSQQLAAGGVAVGLAAGWLTRRLLRLLRWFGGSASQVRQIDWLRCNPAVAIQQLCMSDGGRCASAMQGRRMACMCVALQSIQSLLISFSGMSRRRRWPPSSPLGTWPSTPPMPRWGCRVR